MELKLSSTPSPVRERGSALRRIRQRWLLVLAALPFTAVGVGMLLFSVVPNVLDAKRMQSWHQGEARLVTAGTDVFQDDDGATYRARASYTYRYQGREYRGDRVAIQSAADNLGDFQQALGRRLEQALGRGETVPVWIDPDNPHQSVLNRELRWGMLGFSMIFVLLFGGVGSGMLAYACLAPGGNAVADAGSDAPWRARKEWASPTVQSDARAGLWFGWGFTVLWNLIAIPAGIAVTAEYLDNGNGFALVGLLFPAVGLALAAWASRNTMDWRRFGRAPLTLDPYPGAIGGQVGGTIDVNLRHDPRHRFEVTLSCVYSFMSGSGKNRRRSERLVWQSEGIAQARDHYGRTRLEILFDVEPGLPASDPGKGSAYHLWRLAVRAAMPGADFDRCYELPVFPTGEWSRELRALSVEHPDAAEHRLQQIESVLDLRQIPGGVELHYPPFRHVAGKLLGVLFGVVFFGAGMLAGSQGAPLVFPVIFGLLGGAIALASLYSLVVGLDVRLDGTGLTTRRNLLGIPAGGARVPRDELRTLRLKKSYSTSKGRQHISYFKIQALTRSGRAVDVGYNLAGRETAREALESIALLTGLDLEPPQGRSTQ